MRHTTAVLLLSCLTLTGCSSFGSPDNKPAPTVTVTKTPTLTAAEKRQACVDAWTETIKTRPADFDPDTDDEEFPAACEGLPKQVEMYWEASSAIADANREALDACAEDPSCTSWPVSTSQP